MKTWLARLGYVNIDEKNPEKPLYTPAWAFSHMPQGALVSVSPINTVHRITINHEDIYIKHYTGAGKGLRRYLGLSRIWREWQNLHLFAAWGISVPDILLFQETRIFAWHYRGLLITQGVPHASSLAELREQGGDELQQKIWKEQVFTQICDILQLMHSQRFYHGDLKWRNILISETSVNPKVYLIDCPQGRITPSWLWPRRRRKDLANMDLDAAKCFSKSERLRWFLRYHQTKKLTPILKQEITQILEVNKARKLNKKFY